VQAIIDIDGILFFKHPDGRRHQKPLNGLAERTSKNRTWQEDHLKPCRQKTHRLSFSSVYSLRFHAKTDKNKSCIYSEVHTIPDTPSLLVVSPGSSQQ